MANYITIDSGSTNTRITLMADGTAADTLKFRAAIAEGGREDLAQKIKKGIAEILRRNGKMQKDVTRILACGMITSEFGLRQLDHLPAPCGIGELADGLYETVLDDITDVPFVFVRGIKCRTTDRTDVMRGEEAEIYGITETPEPNSLYVLPGSHSKLIYIDEHHRIASFSTELTGEMIGALAGNTILKSMVDLSQSALDEKHLQKGYLCAREHGLNAALFQVRMLKLFEDATPEQVFSSFIGAVLTGEIQNIIRSAADKVIIGGKSQLKDPTALLLRMNCDKQIETVPDESSDLATAYGCVRIYEASGK